MLTLNNLIIPEGSEQIQILAEDSPRGYRWDYCYLHGQAQDMNRHDIFMATQPMPTEAGNYLCTLQGAPVVAVIAQRRGMLNGRLALLNDTEALTEALDVEGWR